MKPAKQIVFRYNGDPSTEEIDLDMDGDKSVPEQGSFIERKGERWKVVQVNVEWIYSTSLMESTSTPVPMVWRASEPSAQIHRVFLTNEL